MRLLMFVMLDTCRCTKMQRLPSYKTLNADVALRKQDY